MAKIDLTSFEWCELIFKGKNKAYGAYKMRADSPKRHNVAMVIVLIIALVGFSLPTLIKMATPKQKEVMTEVTTLSQLEEPEVKQEEMKRVEPVAPPPPALKSSIKFTAPVIKKDEEVHEDDEIKSQEELTQTKVAISIADVKGNDSNVFTGGLGFAPFNTVHVDLMGLYGEDETWGAGAQLSMTF